MGSPPVLDGARHCRPAELDVTLVAYRSSGSEGLSERWKMVGRDEFSIGINQSKNNNSNIDNSSNTTLFSNCLKTTILISSVQSLASLKQKSFYRIKIVQ